MDAKMPLLLSFLGAAFSLDVSFFGILVEAGDDWPAAATHLSQ